MCAYASVTGSVRRRGSGVLGSPTLRYLRHQTHVR